MNTRRQATLFLPASCADHVESIRSRFNPEQAKLIRAHVTLCREDEVHDWGVFRSRLVSIHSTGIKLKVNRIVRDGNLVYATCDNTDSFHALRHRLLATERSEPRHHQPHLTLIHPRNGICDDDTYGRLAAMFKPFVADFDTATVIEQTNGGIWRELFCHSIAAPHGFPQQTAIQTNE